MINNEQTFLKGYNGAWIFRHRDSWIISVPPDCITLAQHAAAEIPTETLQTESVLHEIFGDRFLRTIGLAYQGYADIHDVHGCDTHPTRPLTGTDAGAIRDLLGTCTPQECDHSTVTPENAHLFGAFEGERLMSVATYLEYPGAAELGILTRPEARRKKYAASALSLAIHAAFDASRLPVYQTLLANEGAMRLAQSLHLHQYATHIAVRLRD